MGAPGYVYLVGRETKDGAWAKVGIAARIGRVYDHERQGWTMLVRTFERDLVLEDPRSVERSVLSRFPDAGSLSDRCGTCGAPKPLVGRTGSDGLTEVRHLPCHAGLPSFFAEMWKLRFPEVRGPGLPLVVEKVCVRSVRAAEGLKAAARDIVASLKEQRLKFNPRLRQRWILLATALGGEDYSTELAAILLIGRDEASARLSAGVSELNRMAASVP